MKRKTLILISGSLLFVIIAVVIAITMHNNRVARSICEEKSKLIQETIEQVENLEVDALFLSMYPIENYDENILDSCLQVDTKILKVPLKSGKEMVSLLENILTRPNKLTRVFLGTYEESITKETSDCHCLEFESEWIQNGYEWEEAILEIAKAYPDIIFEVMFYYPKMSYWLDMKEERVEELLDWYAYAGEMYSHHDIVQNLHPYMPGAEEWLICNESNYQDDYNLTHEIAGELERLVLCDYKTIMVPDSVEKQCGQLRELIETYQTQKRKYGTHTKHTYIFLGDSVIGNYTNSLSIPGVVAYMTGADTINCGYGGLAATKATGDDIGISGVLDYMLSEENEGQLKKLENVTTQEGIREFWGKDISRNARKVTFFISFGINDCASKYPVYNDDLDDGCYYGALKNAVDRLQEAYPKAQIVLMTPNYVEYFAYNSIEEELYEDYVEAVRYLARQEELQVIDVYNELGITAENAKTYLADACHPNNYGRFKIGEMIWKHVQSNKKK